MPVTPRVVPVTVWAPAIEAEQTAAAHDPSGAIVKVVLALTSPSEFEYWSNPSAVYDWELPALIEADAGDSTRLLSAAAVTVSDVVPGLP